MNLSGQELQAVERQDKQRPLLLVVHERFKNGHAMYRSYAPLLEPLTEQFEVHALVEEHLIDAPAEVMFDKVHKLPKDKPRLTKALAAFIQGLKPDMLLYPSLGMSHWTTMLSNLRLAPIQVLAQGHPATSMSSEIDYAFVSPMEGSPELIHSERLLIGSRPVEFELHQDLPNELPPNVAPSVREVKIAVSSKVMKLSHRLMDICVKINEAAQVPIKFRFFPGEFGWLHDGVTAAINSWVPNASVAPYQTYPEFLQDIASCDLALSAFPFGNTNSSVDTCLLGLPTVVHFGPETPAQTDAMVLRVAGFPEWLICDSDESYFAAAMRLVNDPAERSKITLEAERSTIRNRLATGGGNKQPTDLKDLLWFVYRNHESIQKKDCRVIRHVDLEGYQDNQLNADR